MTITKYCYAGAILFVACQHAPGAQRSSAATAAQVRSTPLPSASASRADAHAARSEARDPEVSRLRWEPLAVAELPASPARVGEVVRALKWQDDGGARAAAFVRTVDASLGRGRLQVLLWATPAQAEPTLLQQVQAEVANCHEGRSPDFEENAFWLTDLDWDGHAELTFAYQTSCAPDPSLALKLVVLEEREQYSVDAPLSAEGTYSVAAAPQADESAQGAPVFQLHAARVCEELDQRAARSDGKSSAGRH